MQDASYKKTKKTKIQTQSSADRITTSHNIALHNKQTNKKLRKNFTLYKGHTNHWTYLRRAETKRKTEFNLLQGKNSTFLEAWEKENSNRITWEKKRKGTETLQK